MRCGRALWGGAATQRHANEGDFEMRVCVVGGIFGRSADYRSKHVYTPETVLAAGLRARGVDVDTYGHNTFVPSHAYDVVHVHHFGKAALRMATARIDVPFVFTGHDGCLLRPGEMSAVKRAVFHYVLRSSDAVVALSQPEAQYIERLTAGQHPVVTIPNGIPADVFRFDPREQHRRRQPHRVLFVGQLIQLKGVDVLLRAFQQIAHQYDVRLQLVYQNAQLEAAYRQLAADLSIRDKVEFLGFRSATEIAALYQEADVFVLPSFAEALPSTVTEAMLSGLPVVATTVGGIPEQVGEWGKLVQPGDVGQLAAALAAVLDDLPLYQQSAPAIRARAVQQFSIAPMVDAHLQLYERVLAHKRQRRAMLLDHPMRVATQVYWGVKERARAR